VTCFSPLKGYRSRTVNPTGKRSICFTHREAYTDLPVDVPCGQCMGCRLERSRQWAMRCMHEASLYAESCFVTLTYDDDHLPDDGGVHPHHFVNLVKRLRHFHEFRYFHCGEYGDESKRPHYHALFFGWCPDDLIHYSNGPSGEKLYISPYLERMWKFGFVTVGDVTFASAAYVARYATKKITGPKAIDHYLSCNSITGEIHQIRPEYVTMSRRPGIGKGWYDKFGAETYRDDSVIVNEREVQPPKFYDRLLEGEDPEALKAIKAARIEAARKWAANNTAERLAVRETIQKAKAKLLKRTLS